MMRVYLLFLVCAFCILYVILISSDYTSQPSAESYQLHLRQQNFKPIKKTYISNKDIEKDNIANMFTHLIIVAGHAVMRIESDILMNSGQDKAWYLLPYQLEQGTNYILQAETSLILLLIGFPIIIESHIRYYS